MNVALLGTETIPAVTGADRVVERLLEHYSPDNEYWVYLRAGTVTAPATRRNVHHVALPAPSGKRLGSFTFFLLCSLHYLYQKHYDIAHVHTSNFGVFAPILRLRRSVPVLGTFHGDPYTRQKRGALARGFMRLSERCFVQYCDRLTSVSKFKDRASGFTRIDTRVDHVPNGIDDDLSPHSAFSDPLLVQHGLVGGRYIMFACGRLDRTKGLHDLIDAYERVNPPERLLIVGNFRHDRKYAAAIERRIAASPRASKRICVVRELLPRERLLHVLRGARLFVFPSRYEAMSMMLLDAVSVKTPVVASNIPANLAVVGVAYEHAYPAGDPDALASALTRALAERDWQCLTEDLYARCMRDFSWPSIARRYEDIYAQLSAARGAAQDKSAPSSSS